MRRKKAVVPVPYDQQMIFMANKSKAKKTSDLVVYPLSEDGMKVFKQLLQYSLLKGDTIRFVEGLNNMEVRGGFAWNVDLWNEFINNVTWLKPQIAKSLGVKNGRIRIAIEHGVGVIRCKKG